MEILKKHYEKVLLGVVLLGLAAGAVFMIMYIPSERAALEEKSSEIKNRPAQPLPPLELTNVTALIGRVGGTDCLDLANSNRVFNTMMWLRKGDDNSTLRKISSDSELGPKAIEVTKITPLYTIITFESVLPAAGSESGPRYDLTVEREAASKASQRTRKHSPGGLNTKTDTFYIREVKGSPENPSELLLEMIDTGERVAVSKEKPYKRVDGYMADFRYPPDKKVWTNQRVGAGGAGTPAIMIAGESYIVVAISKNEVVFSAKSNNKNTPRPYMASL